MRLLGLFWPLSNCLWTDNLGFSFKNVINKKMPLPTTSFLKKKDLWYFIKLKEKGSLLVYWIKRKSARFTNHCCSPLKFGCKSGSPESRTFPKVQIVYTNNIFFWTLWRKHILLLHSSQLDNELLFSISPFFKPPLFLYSHGNHPQIMLEAAECSLEEDSSVSRPENATFRKITCQVEILLTFLP